MKNLVSQILKTKGDKVWSIAPQETAYKALQLMSEKKRHSWLLTKGRLLDSSRNVIMLAK